MSNLATLQREVAEWHRAQFGDPPNKEWCAMIVAEEAGELLHHVLKQEQGIRRDENHAQGIADALGDIVVAACACADGQGVSLADCVAETWAKVKKRNWREETEHE